MSFTELTTTISNTVWGWPMMILLLGTHLFLTIRLKFPQRKLWTALRLSVRKDKQATGDVSQFTALATSLAATIGTGNIVGVATAVSLGGPGAVLWCWLTGVFGIATKYSEGLLAIKYRVMTQRGQMLGGPMYALDRGLNMKWLAVLFCIFTAFAAFGIGNTVQANAISENLSSTFCTGIEAGTMRIISGSVLVVCLAMTIIGGVKSIGRICGTLVPLMAICYVGGCVYILIANSQYVLPAVKLIISEAFSFKASLGGAAGTAIMTAARYGIARGLFSNESGLGSAPIVAAAAQTRNPVRQALVSSTGTFWDTVIICALTGLVLVSSILANPDIGFSDGGLITKEAFSTIPVVGTPILSFGIITFAFSTILGWCYYGERAVEYLSGRRCSIFTYRILFIIGSFFGSIMNLDTVWNIADIMNALMAIPNLVSLLFLSGIVAKETRHYLWDKNLDEDDEDKDLMKC